MGRVRSLVALVAVPVMLSPSAIENMKAIYTFVYKMLYPAISQCEQLEWLDVPMASWCTRKK